MRNWLQGLVVALGVAALAGPATAQTGNRTFEGSYSVIARGVDAGDFNYRFTQTGSTYTASATREMKGWVGAALQRQPGLPLQCDRHGDRRRRAASHCL